ncbi:hypothetical protein CVT26_005006 [Gymnopilus dilepis]|uniref:Uncharacterized protein n=1 Tax=Gymnopilus dilepis TaxID=231916 RepID=A0A409Y050_9AGAR|nr:hypothetical protein CVT26_005006 [Gymnopilus dilepis]
MSEAGVRVEGRERGEEKREGDKAGRCKRCRLVAILSSKIPPNSGKKDPAEADSTREKGLLLDFKFLVSILGLWAALCLKNLLDLFQWPIHSYWQNISPTFGGVGREIHCMSGEQIQAKYLSLSWVSITWIIPVEKKRKDPWTNQLSAGLFKEGLVTNLRLGFEKQKARAQENETSRSLGRSPFQNGVRI